MRTLYMHIAAIVDFITKLRDPLCQSSHADCGRSQLDAAHALTESERHAENTDCLAHAWQLRTRNGFICHRSFDHMDKATSRLPFKCNFRNGCIRIGSVVNGLDYEFYPFRFDRAKIGLLALQAICESEF